jgi:pyruvate/2-oxoacid:ferredoxin oxidoreductase beta subunit
VEIKRDNRTTEDIKRTRLLQKCNTEKKENLDQVIEELKQKVSAKTQRLSRYRKRQNQHYQNKLFRTDCKKFYVSGRHISMRKLHQTKTKRRIFGGKYKYMGKKFNIMERHTGLKTSTNKIQSWNGAQYVKKMLQRH